VPIYDIAPSGRLRESLRKSGFRVETNLREHDHKDGCRIEANISRQGIDEDDIEAKTRRNRALFAKAWNDWRDSRRSEPSGSELSMQSTHEQTSKGQEIDSETQAPNPTPFQGVQSLGRGGYNQLTNNDTFAIAQNESSGKRPLLADSNYFQIQDTAHSLWVLPPEVRAIDPEYKYWCAIHQKIFRSHAISEARTTFEEERYCWETQWYPKQGSMMLTNPLPLSSGASETEGSLISEGTTLAWDSDDEDVEEDNEIVYAMPRASNGNEGRHWVRESRSW